MDEKWKQSILAAHAAAKTEQERAVVEAHALIELRREGRGKDHWETDVASLFGVSSHSAVKRNRLFHAGDLADPLWPLVDGEMTLSTAVLLVRGAKSTRQKGETTKQCLTRLIQEYDALPLVRYLPGGKVLRVAARSDSYETAPNAAAAAQRAAAPKATTSTEEGEPKRVRSDAAFWSALRELCFAHAREQLRQHPPEQLEVELRRLNADLQVAFEQFRLRIRRAASETPLAVALSRGQMREACRALKIDPPKDITAIPSAFFEKAKKQFRALAREYHPDSHGGSEETRALYEAVSRAWGILQAFEIHAQPSPPPKKKEKKK